MVIYNGNVIKTITRRSNVILYFRKDNGFYILYHT